MSEVNRSNITVFLNGTPLNVTGVSLPSKGPIYCGYDSAHGVASYIGTFTFLYSKKNVAVTNRLRTVADIVVRKSNLN